MNLGPSEHRYAIALQSFPWVGSTLQVGWVGMVGLGRNFPPFGVLARVVGLSWKVGKNKAFYTVNYVSFKIIKLLM